MDARDDAVNGGWDGMVGVGGGTQEAQRRGRRKATRSRKRGYGEREFSSAKGCVRLAPTPIR